MTTPGPDPDQVARRTATARTVALVLMGVLVVLLAVRIATWPRQGEPTPTVVTVTATAPASSDPSSAGPGARPSSAGPGAEPSTDPGTDDSGATDPESGLAWVDLADLPPQAADTVRLIEAGGPFRYSQDGAVFSNREGVLPAKSRGYYREYTVPTPGSRDRGARRIVTGDRDRILYWTADHYDSFERIRR